MITYVNMVNIVVPRVFHVQTTFSVKKQHDPLTIFSYQEFRNKYSLRLIYWRHGFCDNMRQSSQNYSLRTRTTLSYVSTHIFIENW